jgi:hypothetical protein
LAARLGAEVETAESENRRSQGRLFQRLSRNRRGEVSSNSESDSASDNSDGEAEGRIASFNNAEEIARPFSSVGPELRSAQIIHTRELDRARRTYYEAGLRRAWSRYAEEPHHPTQSLYSEGELRIARLRYAEARFRHALLSYAEADFRTTEELRSARSGYVELRGLLAQLPKSELHAAMDQWHGIVDQYSALMLTRNTDLLPALSGLAQRMEPFLGVYRAGLWGKTFLRDMMWRVDRLVPGLRRPPKYRGPSWSWVSVNTKVSFWTEVQMSPRSAFTCLFETSSCSLRSGGVRSRNRNSSGSARPIKTKLLLRLCLAS